MSVAQRLLKRTRCTSPLKQAGSLNLGMSRFYYRLSEPGIHSPTSIIGKIPLAYFQHLQLQRARNATKRLISEQKNIRSLI